ncbi:MAG: hypothetical protein JNL70_16450 [Saprospiraceae bacterium]|nr:hypothetical protein [Saprospiraceae bacterium]
MRNKNLSELSLTELNGKEKTMKTVLGAYIGILSVLAVMIILLFVQKQYTIALPLLVVLFSSSIIVFTSKKQLNDVKKEIETRK